ncbi:hypothetical protein [Geodermatophilus sp. SYSU D01045]
MDATTARLLARAIHETNDLADELERAGSPQLRENLDAAYDLAPFSPQPDDFAWIDDLIDDDDLQGEVSRLPKTVEAFEDDLEGEDVGGTVPHLEDTSLLDADIPEEFQERFKKVLQLGRRASNDLSLILSEGYGFDEPLATRRRRRGFFAAFGDARWSIQRAAIATMHSDYDVLLAPHHGTFSLPPGFPKAHMCIAQAGSDHFERWNRHLGPHNQARSCINTHLVGTVSVW